MQKYIKRPFAVEAIQMPEVGGELSDEQINWLEVCSRDFDNVGDGSLLIHTLEGTMTASPLDWIIKGVNGEIYPCKPDIFDKTYMTQEEYAASQ